MDARIMKEMDGDKSKDYFIRASFLGTITGISILFGFGSALAIAKKKDPNSFLKGMQVKGSSRVETGESGGSLALRALGWGSLYAVSGFTLFCFTIWKSLGVKNMEEFRNKVGSILPTIPKKESEERTEFSSLSDLLNYIIAKDKKE